MSSWSPEDIQNFPGDSMTNTTEHAQRYMLDDHPTQIIFLAVLLCFICVFGLLGNVAVVLVVTFSPKLQTVTNAFIASLSVCSFITCLTIPYHLTTILMEFPPGQGGCVFVAGILITTQMIILITLTLIALNRVSVMRASSQSYHKIFSKLNAGGMIAASWFLPILVVTVASASGFASLGYNDKYKICIVHPESSSVASMVAGIAIGFPSLLTIVVCYIFIFKFTRHHHSEIKRGLSRDVLRSSCDYLDARTPSVDALDEITPCNKSTTITRLSSFNNLSKESPVRNSFIDPVQVLDKRKSATERIISKRQHKINRNLFFIVCLFVVLVMPFCFVIVIPNSDIFIVWFGVLLLSNSAINPVLYGFLHPQFKEAFKSLVECHKVQAIQDNSGLYGRLTSFTSHSLNKRRSIAA